MQQFYGNSAQWGYQNRNRSYNYIEPSNSCLMNNQFMHQSHRLHLPIKSPSKPSHYQPLKTRSSNIKGAKELSRSCRADRKKDQIKPIDQKFTAGSKMTFDAVLGSSRTSGRGKNSQTCNSELINNPSSSKSNFHPQSNAVTSWDHHRDSYINSNHSNSNSSPRMSTLIATSDSMVQDEVTQFRSCSRARWHSPEAKQSKQYKLGSICHSVQTARNHIHQDNRGRVAYNRVVLANGRSQMPKCTQDSQNAFKIAEYTEKYCKNLSESSLRQIFMSKCNESSLLSSQESKFIDQSQHIGANLSQVPIMREPYLHQTLSKNENNTTLQRDYNVLQRDTIGLQRGAIDMEQILNYSHGYTSKKGKKVGYYFVSGLKAKRDSSKTAGETCHENSPVETNPCQVGPVNLGEYYHKDKATAEKTSHFRLRQNQSIQMKRKLLKKYMHDKENNHKQQQMDNDNLIQGEQLNECEDITTPNYYELFLDTFEACDGNNHITYNYFKHQDGWLKKKSYKKYIRFLGEVPIDLGPIKGVLIKEGDDGVDIVKEQEEESSQRDAVINHRPYPGLNKLVSQIIAQSREQSLSATSMLSKGPRLSSPSEKASINKARNTFQTHIRQNRITKQDREGHDSAIRISKTANPNIQNHSIELFRQRKGATAESADKCLSPLVSTPDRPSVRQNINIELYRRNQTCHDDSNCRQMETSTSASSNRQSQFSQVKPVPFHKRIWRSMLKNHAQVGR